MAVADAEQWLGIVLVVVWCVAAVAAVLPRGRAVLTRHGWAPGPVVVGSGAATVLFAAQAGVVDAVADPGRLARLDTPVLDWFVAERSGPWTSVAKLLSDGGGTAGMTVLTVVGVAVLWWRQRRVDAAVLVVAALGAAALSTGFKTLYERPRPPAALRLVVENNASLPSGHALGSTVVIGMLAALVCLSARSTVLRVGTVAVATTAVLAIGTSRLYLGVHWFTDVLTGWLLGGAWLAVCVTATVLITGPAPRTHASSVASRGTHDA